MLAFLSFLSRLSKLSSFSELINAKPKARRRILEEAAGISGLYQRRHEAELKLKGAETNLGRVDDVLEQLESQNRESPANTLIDDLPLFSAQPVVSPTRQTVASELREKLSDINPDELTPREALEALYALKSLDT